MNDLYTTFLFSDFNFHFIFPCLDYIYEYSFSDVCLYFSFKSNDEMTLCNDIVIDVYVGYFIM